MNLAVFPADVDCLFLDKLFKKNKLDVLYFVEENSPIEKWAVEFLPAESTIRYRFYENCENSSLEDLLYKTNLTQLFAEKSVRTIYTSIEKITPAVEEWAAKNHCSFIGTSYSGGGYLENKLVFDEFMEENSIPKPSSQKYSMNTNLLINPPFVLQLPESSGSEGTYIVENIKKLKELTKSISEKKDNEFLLREYINGICYGISLFIGENTYMSSLRVQCMHEGHYAGIQWIKSADIEIRTIKNIESIFSRVGNLLKEKKFRGFANFDFIIDHLGKIYIIECNPRYSAAVTHMAAFPELIHSADFITPFVGELKKKNNGSVLNVEGDFSGSLLYIDVHPEKDESIKIKNTYRCGVYEIKDDDIRFLSPDPKVFDEHGKKILLVSEADPEKKYTIDATIATVFSNFPLYTHKGDMNKNGKIVMNRFSFI